MVIMYIGKFGTQGSNGGQLHYPDKIIFATGENSFILCVSDSLSLTILVTLFTARDLLLVSFIFLTR